MSIFTNQPGTLIGPLTTSFLIPQSCTVNFRVNDSKTKTNLFQGQICRDDLDPNDSPLEDNYRCWPPPDTSGGFEPPTHPLVGWGFYSPGLACPTGYTSACTATYGGSSDWDIQFSLRPSETAIGCCPQGFKCTNSNGNKCVASAPTPFVVPTAACSGTEMVRSVLATLTTDEEIIRDSANSVIGTSTRTSTLWAPLFQLNHQPTDLIKTSSAPTSSTLPATTAARPSPATTTLSKGHGSGENSQTLSSGAWVGIGLGVGGTVISLGAVILWYMWKRRNHGRSRPEDVPTSEDGGHRQGSASDISLIEREYMDRGYGIDAKAELQGGLVHVLASELDATPVVAELAGKRVEER